MPEGRVATLTRAQAFERLRSNLELTAPQETTVAARQTSVRAAVARQLPVVDTFLTGSYRRQTLIGPLKRADVDIVVVLDREYKKRGPRAVLELVKKALLVEYTKTPEISRNGQAVTITFSDFIVDVVPAFVRPWWAWDDGWDICDSGSDGWICYESEAPCGDIRSRESPPRWPARPVDKAVESLESDCRRAASLIPRRGAGVVDLRQVVVVVQQPGIRLGQRQVFLQEGTRQAQRTAPRPGWHRQGRRRIPPRHRARRGSEQGGACVRRMHSGREGIRGERPSCHARGIRPDVRQLLPVLTATRLPRPEPLVAPGRTLSRDGGCGSIQRPSGDHADHRMLGRADVLRKHDKS